MFLENREDLLPVGNRLIPQQPALDLVELPPSMRDKTLDGLTGAFLDPLGSKCGDRLDRPFDQPAAALQIRFHPLRTALRPARRAHPVE